MHIYTKYIYVCVCNMLIHVYRLCVYIYVSVKIHDVLVFKIAMVSVIDLIVISSLRLV